MLYGDIYNAQFSDDKKTLKRGPLNVAGIYNVPLGIEYIAASAFIDCRDISSIVIPETVKEIGQYAFNKCLYLSDVILPQGIEVIKNSSFCECPRLKSVVLPKSVTRIEQYAFYLCGSLSSVNFPPELTDIGDYSFARSGLTSIDLPEGLLRIGRGAFSETKITSIYLPENIVLIGEDAFRDCSNLREIVVPNGQKNKFLQFKALEEYKFIIKEKEGMQEVKLPAGDLDILKFTEGASILLHYADLAKNSNNQDLAIKLYEDAEKLGSLEATYRLGLIFVNIDYYKGYFYINKAAQAGHAKAIEKLNKLQSNR